MDEDCFIKGLLVYFVCQFVSSVCSYRKQLPVCVSVCLSMLPSTHLYSCICHFFLPTIYISRLSIYLSVCLRSIKQSSIYLSIYMTSIPVYPFTCLSFYLSFCPPLFQLSVSKNVCLLICLSV